MKFLRVDGGRTLRICCTPTRPPARPPATRLKADEGMRASILLCRLANLFGELAVGKLVMKSEIPFDAVRCPPSAGGIYEFPRGYFEFRPGLRLDCARRLRCSIMKVLAVSLALALCVPCAALTVGTLARPRAFPRRCSSPQANMFDVTNSAPILIANTAPVLTLLAKSGMDNAVDDLLRIFPLVFLVRRSLRTFLTTPSARPALSCCSHCRPRRALHAHARREGLP